MYDIYNCVKKRLQSLNCNRDVLQVLCVFHLLPPSQQWNGLDQHGLDRLDSIPMVSTLCMTGSCMGIGGGHACSTWVCLKEGHTLFELDYLNYTNSWQSVAYGEGRLLCSAGMQFSLSWFGRLCSTTSDSCSALHLGCHLAVFSVACLLPGGMSVFVVSCEAL